MLSLLHTTAIATETMKVKRFLKRLDRKYANLAILVDQTFDVVVDQARQIEMSCTRDDGNRPKKSKAKGSSGVPRMTVMGGGSQSNYDGRIRSNKKGALKHKSRGFKSEYSSSSGQSFGCSSSRSGLGSSFAPCTQCGRVHSEPYLVSTGGCFKCG